MPQSPLLVVRRQTHYLVYAPEQRDEAGWKELARQLTVFEKNVRGAVWAAFKAYLHDTDPAGQPILRLPGEVDPTLLRTAFPLHAFQDSPASWVWQARPVAVRFHTSQYPYRNRDQGRIVTFLSEPDVAARLVVAGTAAGKSYCAIRAWTQFGDALLGTFAQVAHLENFRTELLKFTDLAESEILVVDDGRETIRRAMRDRGQLARYKVVLALHRTASRLASSVTEDAALVGKNEFAEFVQAFGVGTHVSDECHLELQSLVTLGLMLNVARTFYLTATPKRTDWYEDRVLQQHLPLSSTLRIRSEPRLEVRQIRFDSRPDEAARLKSVNRRGYFDPNFYVDYLMDDAKWAPWEEMVTDLVGRAFDEDGAVSVGLVVGGRLEFLDRVIEAMRRAFPSRSIGNFSSRVKAGETRMAELGREIVVTTEKSFSGSVNPERMSHLLLLANLASPVWCEQVVGRLRGLEGRPCVLLDVWDAGFEKIVDQAKRRRATYKKISKTMTETNYQGAQPSLPYPSNA